MTQEASRLLEVNYAVSQGTVFQATPGRSLSWLPRFPPQTNVELHIREICLVECQPVGSFICLSHCHHAGTAVAGTVFQSREQQFHKEFLGN